MEWQTYAEMRSPKIEPDVPGSCAVCCQIVRANTTWGVQDEERERRGWSICDDCHTRYPDPEVAWQMAEDRWETQGPCRERVLSNG